MAGGRIGVRSKEPQAQDPSPFQTHRVSAALERRRQSCSLSDVDRDQPFSWLRCVTSIVSYGLLLSDVLRTGPGIRDIPKDLYPSEPDSGSSIGPVGYLVHHLTRENATVEAMGRIWPYKYDTTSIGVRAVAQHFQLKSWSPCLLYHERCNEAQGLPLLTVFSMIDSLADVMKDNSVLKEQPRPPVTLRVDSLFRDRVHHYAMPWFYEDTVKRTIQVTHHAWDSGQWIDTSVCSSMRAHRPYSCAQTWTSRLKVPCTQSHLSCRMARSAWQEIPRRIHKLLKLYPDKTIDSVIVDGMDDYSHGGLAFPGRRRAEVVVLSRVQSCVNQTCTTVAVDDYRFETAMLMMNVRQWFGFVALLRVIGQAYTWLRVFLLLWVCHASRRNANGRYQQFSRLAQCKIVLRTLFLVPSQVVVYGSLVPISLYYMAHLIDSPALYALVSVRFNSLWGRITWNFADIAHYCAVSMRAVWVLSFYCHLTQAAFTKCQWSPAFGVPGISEFVITFIASLTLVAQYRALSLRDTSVLQIYPVLSSARVHQLRSYPRDASRTALRTLLFGTTIDWKCLVQAMIATALLFAMLRALHRLFPKCFPFHFSIMSRTLVPYCAGYLWPRNRLVVSWIGSLVTMSSTRSVMNDAQDKVVHLDVIGLPTVTRVSAQRLQALRQASGRSLVQRPTEDSVQARRQLQSVTSRSREIESAIYLMNLAVMTDPVTMLQLRFLSGRRVALYESKLTHECCMLPYDLRTSNSDIAIDWGELQLIAVMNTKDLVWDDLLRCG